MEYVVRLNIEIPKYLMYFVIGYDLKLHVYLFDGYVISMATIMNDNTACSCT
uniref:Uncharacterized protein n=1 Tax=Amphimedon queenslandica TaxID=400682 RepID=A0A1X7UK83_AMPQE